MKTDTPPVVPPSSAVNSPAPTQAPAPKRRRRWLLFGCGGFLALLVVIAATVAFTWWWIQRPIKPVVLTAQEKTVVEEKLDRLGAAAKEKEALTKSAAQSKPVPESTYQPGSKILRLTDREINGLLNENTDLGHSVRLAFDRDAINAYVAVPIPEDAPILGGKMFRARGRFRLSLAQGGEPYAVLEDVTVYGISLPNAWLGGLKGSNLLEQAVGQRHGEPLLKGVKDLHIEPGALVMELED